MMFPLMDNENTDRLQAGNRTPASAGAAREISLTSLEDWTFYPYRCSQSK